jgi:L-lactate dehydrogenase complex protein LldF
MRVWGGCPQWGFGGKAPDLLRSRRHMTDPGFPARARLTLRDTQMRRNIGKATATIRARTARVTAELPDWEALRDAGQAIKRAALAGLDGHLLMLEARVIAAGGVVHWASDAAEARRIIVGLVQAEGADEVVKIKSMTTDEIALNPALEAVGVRAQETDLADMIVQMAGESPSHLLVPAIHKNRAEIRALFVREMGVEGLSDEPEALTAAARIYLRRRFLRAQVAISGANFAIAQTGSVCVVESEGNGRMCLTLPRVLITLMGIEKVLPRWADLAVFLQLLPRAATGERMNPYTSLWSGTKAGAFNAGDGPAVFHLVLLDNGRSAVLGDDVARDTLNCIRCSRCLNVCPVYERAGGHAYDSMYQGPIGAILTPQLRPGEAGSLPFASSLCGACEAACPVRIPIPDILTHLRARVVDKAGMTGEQLAMRAVGVVFRHPALLALAQAAASVVQKPWVTEGEISHLPWPLSGWSVSREMPAVPSESFRAWWRRERGGGR